MRMPSAGVGCVGCVKVFTPVPATPRAARCPCVLPSAMAYAPKEPLAGAGREATAPPTCVNSCAPTKGVKHRAAQAYPWPGGPVDGRTDIRPKAPCVQPSAR